MIRIAIADDHPLIVQAIHRALEHSPLIQIVGAADTTLGVLELLEREPCDVLLTDFHFEGADKLNGYAFLDHVGQRHKEVRVVVLTSFATEEVLRALRLPCVYGALSKRTEHSALLSVISIAARFRRWFDPLIVPNGLAGAIASGSDLVHRGLSRREGEVLRLLLSGLRVTQIARLLGRSTTTISTQKVTAMAKLGARSEAELFRLGFAMLDD